MEPLRQLAKEKLEGKRVIAVMSAKGGVGKSVISSLLAFTLSQRENTSIVDLDIHTMAMSKLFGLEGRLHEVTKNGIEPFSFGNLGVFSLSGVVRDNYVLLPGINQGKVMEGLIAYANIKSSKNVIFDLPPGMGDEILVLERISKYFPIVVTTPSKISTKVVEYLIKYLVNEKRVKPSLIVNMAYFDCNGEIVRPFGEMNGVRSLANEYNVNFFEFPIDPNVEDYVGKIIEYKGSVKVKTDEVVTSLFYSNP
ncbi:ATP-binding protein [Candidatus Acidianus copahuensis]|uniref:ATP-binding protein n=1 Tax=Candidatus Acidianus copahuensis TaxID=1160895 RepID=A0A031LK30_9CREN|nr:P-loop NTPase [Candidatus Acidianus copahuensis]EZQ01594.1 ATP-binding protein [Candidatus Acidianus copahuensis]